MNKIELSAIEKEMASFDFAALQAEVEGARKGIASAASATDIKEKICGVWSKIRKYVKLAENIPIIGKYISLLSSLLDSVCGNG